MKQPKFVFVIGGVMSGIGKGVTTASIGRILKDYGFAVTAVKIDPYLNIDAGTMNPIEHGEVFVTEDGLESDQDLGNYERFLDQNIPRANYMTSGLVYQTVLQRERNLEYQGKCVETIPHISEEVIRRLETAAASSQAEVVMVEIGGTVGEYQNLVYLEAARIMKLKNPDSVLFVLVSYLPVPHSIGEMKTKPTQYAVRTLNSAGIQPDIIIARSNTFVDEVRKAKLSLACNVHPEDVISAPDVASIYQVPLNFERDKIGLRILNKFNLKVKRKNNRRWKNLVKSIELSQQPVKIGIVGKYFNSGAFTLADSYISVIEAIKHACWAHQRKPEITWLDAEKYEKDARAVRELKNYQGVIIPGGFGSRGIEGKLKAIQFLRENNIPFLGLCYGLQLAVIEFARNLCQLKTAHTTEINSQTKYPVITTMADQVAKLAQKQLGGSMRLGSYNCQLKSGSLARQLYGTDQIAERHRHRYEVNNKYRACLEEKGLVVSGVNPDHNLVEVIELPGHKFFLATQFHPELKSRPLNPHPLFKGFIQAALS